MKQKRIQKERRYSQRKYSLLDKEGNVVANLQTSDPRLIIPDNAVPVKPKKIKEIKTKLKI